MYGTEKPKFGDKTTSASQHLDDAKYVATSSQVYKPIQDAIGQLATVALGFGVAALSAWAFTSISPLTGGALFGTYILTTIITEIATRSLDLGSTTKKALIMLSSLAITTLIANFIFPALGLSLLSIPETVFFISCHIAGAAALIFILQKLFPEQSVKKEQLPDF